MTGHNAKNRISRRRLLYGTTTLVSAAPVAISAASLTAGAVHAYLKSLDGGWVKLENTVDTFKAGSPDMVVKSIAVGWMSYSGALEKAVAAGCNLFVTHEPTYFNHRDNDASIFRLPAAAAKRKFIEQNGLTIIRCHDIWDQYPDGYLHR